MPMVSYAHNGEDVVLARVFGDRRAGFYVDVGAGHPEVDSVTKHFYDLGWRGINVEPVAEKLALLGKERPRDVNLGTALAEQAGEAVQRYEERTAQVSTLQAVLDAHADATIDFLKIDVEGHEEQVLRGVDFGVWRPRVVVVEATQPSSTEASHEAWEPLLVSHGYEHRLFDGLNRFYIREEDRDALGPALSAPANVLDDFMPFRFSTDHSEARARRAEAELHAAQDAVEELRDELGQIGRAHV